MSAFGDFTYVRETYGMPWLKRGVRVLALGKPGKVTNATHHVFVKLDGSKFSVPYHPDDVKQYVDSGVSLPGESK